MKNTKLLLVLLILLSLFGYKPQISLAQQDVQEVTFMSFELWPDFDRSELLVIHSILLSPQQQLPATVRYPLPENGTLHTVAQFDDTQDSLSDQVNYTQTNNELLIELPTSGLRVEYYVPYQLNGQTRLIDFTWVSAFTADLLQMSVQQPRDTTAFTLNADVLESRVTDNGLRYHILPPSSVNQGETVAISFAYDAPVGALTAPPSIPDLPTAESESSLLNNLANNLPLVGVALLLFLISIIFLRQGWQERQAPLKRPLRNKTCANCGQENKGGSKFCSQCGEPI